MSATRKNGRTFYTVFVFVALGAFDNIVIGLFPPLFSMIARDLRIPISSLGIISAVNILITSLASVYWGYLSGKGSRKKYIIIGTLIWSVAIFFTSRSANFLQLLIFQFITGIGLGCIATIGYSILTDTIPDKYRGMLLSLWGMTQGFGGIAGALMASLIAPDTSWRRPFEIVSVIGFCLIILYLFVKEPAIGESDPELKGMLEKGQRYHYSIQVKDLSFIASKPSNIWLLLQGFFMNIATGTLIWLPTMYISKIEHQGYSTHIAIVVAGYLFALLQIGGLTSSFFGYLGDRAQRKTYRGRALLTALFVFLAAPLYTAMFLTPTANLELPDSHNPAVLLASLLREIILDPWMTAMFVLAFLAAASQSANTPNWLALITEVNLPEHRSTVFSTANLLSGLGRTVGNVGFGFVLAMITANAAEPNNYVYTLIVFQLFFLPSAFCYLKMSRSNSADIKKVKSILRRRTKKS